MANALLQDLAAATTLAGTDLFYVKQAGARGVKATGTQLLALVGTAYVPLAGGTMTGALTLPAGAVGTPSLMFTGAGATDGFYSPGANEIALAIGGGQKMWMTLGGVYFRTNVGVYENNSALIFGTSLDTRLYRDAAASLALRNGTAQQSFSVYNTYTDSSNYERLKLTGVAGTSVNITAETLGTGADNLDIVCTPGGGGNFIIKPAAGTGYQFGNGGVYFGNTGSFIEFTGSGSLLWAATSVPAAADTGLQRGTAGQVDVTNGTAATYRDLKLRNLLAGGGNGSYVQTPSMTVDRLADAATAGAGARAFVTDANATTFLSTVAAGGSNKVPVVSNGTNWLIG